MRIDGVGQRGFLLTILFSSLASAQETTPEDARYKRFERGMTLILQLSDFMAKGNRIENPEDAEKVRKNVNELNGLIEEAKNEIAKTDTSILQKMDKDTEKYSQAIRSISGLPNEYFYENGTRERFIEFHNNATNLLTVLSKQLKYPDRTLNNLRNNLTSLLRDAPGYPSALELYVMPKSKLKTNFPKDFIKKYSAANDVDRLVLDAEIAKLNPGLVKSFYLSTEQKDPTKNPDLPGSERLRHFIKEISQEDAAQIKALRLQNAGSTDPNEVLIGQTVVDLLKKGVFITLANPIDGSNDVVFTVGRSGEKYQMKFSDFSKIVDPQALGEAGRAKSEFQKQLELEKSLPPELPEHDRNYALKFKLQEHPDIGQGSIFRFKAENEKGQLRFEHKDIHGNVHSIILEKGFWKLYVEPQNKVAEKIIDTVRERNGFHAISPEEFSKGDYRTHSVRLKNDVPGIGKKGDVFWAPWVDDGDETKTQIFRISKNPKENHVVNETDLEGFYNLSELKQDLKDSASGEIIAKKGQKIYELYHDKNDVSFVVVDDKDEVVRSMSVEAFKNSTKSLGEGYELEMDSKDDLEDPDKPELPDESGNSSTDVVEEKLPEAGQHGKLPTFQSPEKGFVEPNYKKDCGPRGGKYAKYYKQKPKVPLKDRLKYKEYILEAANATGIHPAILEASIQIETDFRPDLLNTSERSVIKSYLRKKKRESTDEAAEWYAWNNRKSVIGKSIAQIGPAEARALGYNWLGSYAKNKNKPNHIWNPRVGIMAKARLMRLKMDQDARRAAKARGLPEDQAIAYMFNRPGAEGLAEQARYLLSLFNRGIRAVNSMDLFIEQNGGKWPKYYGQVWGATPSKPVPGYLYKQHINRGHVYKGAGLCGPLPEDSLVARYAKEYEQTRGSSGMVWVVSKGASRDESI